MLGQSSTVTWDFTRKLQRAMENNEKTAFGEAVSEVKAGGDAHQAADALLARLTPDEKLALMHGDSSFWQGMLELYTDVYTKRPYPHGTVARLGIPGVQYCD